MALVDVVPNQSLVTRVVSLPLVSSTYDMVSSVYCNTKDSHPYLKSVCEVAELGVKTFTSVALTSAMPIIGKLEPQIAIANDLACKGLDKIEKTLPILHQPSEQVVNSAKNAVSGAKDAVAVKVNGARDTVSCTISDMVDKTRGAVQDGMEMTKSVVNDGVHTVMGSRMANLLATGVDTALTRTEMLVDQYLPFTKEELEKEAKLVEGFDEAQQKPSYYVRLGSLSMKLRRRAYQQAIAKVRDAKQRSQASISQLYHTVDLIEYARKNVDGAGQKLHEKLHSLVEWKTHEPGKEDQHRNEVEHIESRTLAIARNLSYQVQTTCLTLMSSLQGLPQNIQSQALTATRSASEVYGHFSKASNLRDVSDTVLANSKVQLAKMKDSLDGVMDYLVNNTPLNWLVGPFYPRMSPASSSTQEAVQEETTPADVEMKPLDSRH